jgi:hypothetical protein
MRPTFFGRARGRAGGVPALPCVSVVFDNRQIRMQGRIGRLEGGGDAEHEAYTAGAPGDGVSLSRQTPSSCSAAWFKNARRSRPNA